MSPVRYRPRINQQRKLQKLDTLFGKIQVKVNWMDNQIGIHRVLQAAREGQSCIPIRCQCYSKVLPEWTPAARRSASSAKARQTLPRFGNKTCVYCFRFFRVLEKEQKRSQPVVKFSNAEIGLGAHGFDEHVSHTCSGVSSHRQLP
jgi:hypothetical protein